MLSLIKHIIVHNYYWYISLTLFVHSMNIDMKQRSSLILECHKWILNYSNRRISVQSALNKLYFIFSSFKFLSFNYCLLITYCFAQANDTYCISYLRYLLKFLLLSRSISNNTSYLQIICEDINNYGLTIKRC